MKTGSDTIKKISPFSPFKMPRCTTNYRDSQRHLINIQYKKELVNDLMRRYIISNKLIMDIPRRDKLTEWVVYKCKAILEAKWSDDAMDIYDTALTRVEKEWC